MPKPNQRQPDPTGPAGYAPSVACAIQMLSRQVHATAAKLLEPFDISPAQAGLLYQVGRGERVPSQIARQMLVDPSNLSRQIRVLEARGLLTREVDDANRTRAILRLTEAGRSMARRIDPHAAIIEGAIARRLGPSGAAALRRALEQVRLALDEAASQSIPIDDD